MKFSTRSNRQLLLCGGAAIALGIHANASAQQVDEIIVTAEKKEGSLQDTSITLNVLGEDYLDEQGVTEFEDFANQLPNVTFARVAPGQNSVFIRGVAAGSFTANINTFGGSPTVGIYLDEMPVTSINRNIDLHVYDVARVEVLSGPQGTLYGSASMSGTIKYVTNKPDPSSFEAGFEASLSDTRYGEMSTLVQGFVNVPVTDNSAVRLVAYNNSQGGYIDNILGTSEHLVTLGFDNDPANSLGTLTVGPNSQFVEDNFNDANTIGFRAAGLIEFGADWSILASVVGQRIDVDGVFDYEPSRGDLKTVRFSPDTSRDEFQQYSATVNGRIGMLDVVYAGSYLNRDIDVQADYTGYGAAGYYIDYYTCAYNGTYTDLIVPGDPNASCEQQTYRQAMTRADEAITQEIRFSTPSDNRLRATVGAFYADQELKSDRYWYVADTFAIAGDGNVGFADVFRANFSDGTFGPDGSAFGFRDLTRSEEQIAVFGEVTFDLVPDLLSVTGGARWYDIETGLSFDIGTNFGGGSSDFERTDRDVIFKANVTATPSDDALFYFTFSQGFRPGFFNRNGGPQGLGVILPSEVDQDVLDNFEIGWKLTLFDNRLRFNGAAFWMVWENLQQTLFDNAIDNLAFTLNTADARVRGIEADFQFAATDSLTFNGAFAFTDAELTADFDQAGVEGSAPIPASAFKGDQLAFAPKFGGNLGFRFEKPMGSSNNTFFARGNVSYTGKQYNSLVSGLQSAQRELQDDYAIANLGVGLDSGEWNVELFVNNITDERAELFINNYNFDRRITTNRPRTVGVRFGFTY